MIDEKKLPENWLFVSLEQINLRKSKNVIPSNFPNETFESYSVPVYETGKPEFETGEEIKSSKQILETNDVLLCKINPRINRVWIVQNYSDFRKIGSSEWIVVNTQNIISEKFLMYLFSSPKFRVLMQADVSGVGGSLTRARPQIVRKYKFPLAPRPEQDRIVAKVDALMAQITTMQKSMERIPLLLKDFRQQVLTQAVTGKLTEEWREGKELPEWKVVTLIELIKAKPRNGFSPRGVDYPTEVKSLSLGATTSGKFDATKVKYLDIEKPASDSHLWLKKGDILIQRANSLDYVGTSAVYTGEDDDFIYPDIMIKVQANKEVNNIYLNYCLSSSSTREYFKENASGTAGNMPKINQAVVSNTPINTPSLEEQREIVRRVENLLTKADAIEQQYQSLKSKIDTLPQAILHKAFKGELVEQLESDGDARELLREIEGLKTSATKKPATKKKKMKTYKQ